MARLLAALPDAAIAVSPDGHVLAANDAARRLVPGLHEGDPLSRTLRAPDVLDTIRAVRHGAPLTATWRDRVPFERQFDVHVSALGDDSSSATLVVLRDTTEVRRIERMRSDFVANASHELRTPLASLLGFVETLQGPARDDPAARDRFLAIMSEQARRMSRLIDDLLSLSRIEQNLHVRPRAVVDLTSVAGQICDAMTTVAASNDVTLHFETSEPVFVSGDRDELLRVAENLIENAIRHGGAGAVMVTVEKRDGSGVLLVQDSGPGIAREHIPRLTERFYRVDNAASRARGGTGLGLALVKHVAARHRGRLLIESQPGQGTCVTFLVPLAE